MLGNSVRAEDKDEREKLLVGKWEVTKTEEGRLPGGSSVEFTKDGKMKVAAKKDGREVKLEWTYKLVKDKVMFELGMGREKSSDKFPLTKLTDKEMAFEGREGRIVELRKK